MKSLTTAIKTAFRTGLSSGNYDNAYASTNFEKEWHLRFADMRNLSFLELDAYNDGYVVGFFLSYTLREVPARYRSFYVAAKRRWTPVVKSMGIAIR